MTKEQDCLIASEKFGILMSEAYDLISLMCYELELNDFERDDKIILSTIKDVELIRGGTQYRIDFDDWSFYAKRISLPSSYETTIDKLLVYFAQKDNPKPKSLRTLYGNLRRRERVVQR